MPILAVRRDLPPEVVPEPGGTADPTNPGGGTGYALTTADGTIWDLTDREGLLLTLGRRGFDSPTYDAITAESPAFDGEEFLSARALPRDLILPLYLQAETREAFIARKRSLLAGLSPRRGLATLAVTEQDGSQRTLRCYYTGRGGEGDTARDRAGRLWSRLTLELRAPDPYWRGAAIRTEFANPVSSSFYPIPPLQVASSQGLGESTLDVRGDVDAYPVWTVYGPTSGGIELCAMPAGTGERDLMLSSVLAADEWLRVDTDPTRLTIIDQDGANRWGDLESGSSLWSIPPGSLDVEVFAAGVGAGTRVVLEYQPRFETV
jgi:hypothetical protein